MTKLEDQHCEELQEIMNSTPHPIIKYGLLIVCVLSIIGFCIFLLVIHNH